MKKFLRQAAAGVVIAATSSAAAWAQAPVVDLSSTTSRQLVDGVSAGAEFGLRIERGDVNGDINNKDLIVSAPLFNGSQGRVYVFFGWINRTGDFLASNANVTLTGSATGDQFGQSAKTGFIYTTEPQPPALPTTSRDLVVGAPGANGGRGAVYVFAGPLGTTTALTPANATFTILGAPGDNLGQQIETTDLNGDRCREVIIAANNKIYVVDVKNASGTTLDLSTQSPLTVLTGMNAISAMAGGGGDITGDKLEDLAVGDATANSGAGAVYILKGKASGQTWPASVNVTTGADAQFTGERAGDAAGSSLWIADVDGDNTYDLVVGAPDYAGRFASRPNSGAVYLLFGSSAVVSTSSPRSLSTTDIRIFGAAPGDHLGAALALGNITRNSNNDIAMLASGANSGNGRIDIVYGRSKAKFASFSGVIDMESQADRQVLAASGAPISGIQTFDVTGEGADDIVASVPTATTTAGANAGRLYLSLSPSIKSEVTSVTTHLVGNNSSSGDFKILNVGPLGVPLSISSNASWLSVSPTSGTTLNGEPLQVNYAVASGLAAGTYTAYVTVNSTSNEVTDTLMIPVTIYVTACGTKKTRFDYDCDGKADYAFFTPTTGVWNISESSTNFATSSSVGWGTTGDIPVAGDYDGDGREDIAVYRPSTGYWYIELSSTNYKTSRTIGWGGVSGDVPVPGDYDGDGKTDIAIYRPSTGMWWILTSSSNFQNYFTQGWGGSDFTAVPGDYDGDGKTDIAVFRTSTGYWWILTSSSNFQNYITKGWGDSTFIPVPGDYDGDGKTDIAVFRPSTGYWWILTSSSGYANYYTVGWGDSTFQPVPADYDGDGKTDIAVFRPSTGTWWILKSSTGNQSYVTKVWGTSTDIVIPRKQ